MRIQAAILSRSTRTWLVFLCYATLGKLKPLCYLHALRSFKWLYLGGKMGFRRASLKRKLMRIQAAILLTFTYKIWLVFVCYATLGKTETFICYICAVIVVAS